MSQGVLANVRRISFPQFSANGTLTEFSDSATSIPFPIRRVFTIAGVSTGGRRGGHAHRACTQLLACLAGSVQVDLSDGNATLAEKLVADGTGLCIPPMVWNSVTFAGPSTVLAVFCDEPYEESDYLRNWEGYVALMQEGAG